mgnify:CR=1 FL=1
MARFKKFRIPAVAILVAGSPDCQPHYFIVTVEGRDDVGVCRECGRKVNFTQAQKKSYPAYLGKSLKAKW